MRILDGLGAEGTSFSFEFFPPKTEAGERLLFETIAQLRELNPHFVSVTSGAGGSTRGRTVEWAKRIRQDSGIEPMLHLTCRGVPEAELAETIRSLKEAKLYNILALRGDQPQDSAAPEGAYQYADELIRHIRNDFPESCIAAACYPEKHTEASSIRDDLENLRRKADSGADFFITQLFFDNSKYFEFVGRARSMGLTQPILPGIMPIQNVDQVRRFIQMCGASIPPHLMKLLDQYNFSPKAVYHIGIAHAIAQCQELIESGAPGIHFYTLNKSPATRVVVEAIRN